MTKLPQHGDKVWRASDGYGPFTVVAPPGSRFRGSDWVAATDPHGIATVGAPLASWLTRSPSEESEQS